MKILIDTNVVLDALLDREPFAQYATQIFALTIAIRNRCKKMRKNASRALSPSRLPVAHAPLIA